MKAKRALKMILSLVATILLCLAASSCRPMESDEVKAEWDAITLLGKAIEERPFEGPTMYTVTEFEGGKSIVMYPKPADATHEVETYYVFWVCDGKVYRVNSAASMRYPYLPQSPSTVTLDWILSKAKEEYGTVFKPEE